MVRAWLHVGAGTRVLHSDELVYSHKRRLTAKIVRRLAEASRKGPPVPNLISFTSNGRQRYVRAGAKAQSSYLAAAEKP